MSTFAYEALKVSAMIAGVCALAIAGYFGDTKTINRRPFFRFAPYGLLLISWVAGAAAEIRDIHFLILILFGLVVVLHLLNLVSGKVSAKSKDLDDV